MKNTLFGAIAALALSTSVVQANELSFIGETEYAFEAETFSLEGGAQYNINGFTFSGVAQFEDTQTSDFEFTGLELGVGYALTQSVTAYARIEADDDFDHTETVIGASFSF